MLSTQVAGWIVAGALLAGCVRREPTSIGGAMWGQRGLNHGRFQKPRALAIDGLDHLYITDKSGWIQVFQRDGTFLRSWRIPEARAGFPCGLSISRDGNLLVADTHYFRVLTYTPEGELLPDRTIGGTRGTGPGQFGFVTDVVQARDGSYYVAEYGDFDRIQKFDPDGNFVLQWGNHGSEPGAFLRPQSLALDSAGRLWVADACNHRVQVFDVSGSAPKLLKILGQPGAGLGELRYPYAIEFDRDDRLVICELGNHRVQLWTTAGQPIASWGSPGREIGQLNQPWAIAIDSRGDVHVLDTHNHRVQRFRF
jgi:DNA-binding beta-propeller fold protein YncE